MQLTERRHTGEFILAEIETRLSRENVTVTVPPLARLEAGSVLGKLSAGGNYVEFDPAATDGSEEVAGLLYAECDNSLGMAPLDFKAVAITRLAAVHKSALVWGSEVDSNAKAAAYSDMAAKYLVAID